MSKENEDNSSEHDDEFLTVPIGKSPVPKKEGPETMDFFDALFEVAEGNKITKLEWNNVEIYGLMQDNRLRIHKDDGLFYDWIISDGDLYGKDWVAI